MYNKRCKCAKTDPRKGKCNGSLGNCKRRTAKEKVQTGKSVNDNKWKNSQT